MNLELYSNQRSPIHNWDPRTRIVSLTALIISIATLQSLALALLGLVISLSLLVLSRIPLRRAASHLRWPFLFLLPFLLILPITVEGDALASSSSISFSREGLLLGSLIFVKGLASLILAMVMLGCCPFSVTALALRDLRVPDPLVQIFLFTYRYIDLLGQELWSTFRSLSARGFERRSDVRTARVMGNALGALLLRSLARSERMFFAMVSRGYRGHLPEKKAERIKNEDLIKGLAVVTMALALQLWG